ncbi:hypothetical protein JGU66_33380 [Myxococcaceae bacterium JPH2]|nr:hypothetical protein [Myxococcaceae bacterium JPH2]
MVETRESPRVSVNKLGQFLTGTPALRKRIIFMQKHPPEPQYLYYPEATRAITEYLCHGRSDAILRHHQRLLVDAAAQNPEDAHRLAFNADAIERFRVAADELALTHAVPSPADASAPPLEVAGVSINVRPEMLLRSMDRHGEMRSGLLKLYFSMHRPLDERAGQYITTVLQEYAEQRLEQQGVVDHRLVRVFDVFAGRVFVAPRARQRRLSDVRLACEEIAARWDVH